ncbi:methyltransferase domain-containing protein [Flavobacterium cyanobacteriorum]|nr:methyltransferase domain-containing protein [Flavobacterium cyanobacteriorum]
MDTRYRTEENEIMDDFALEGEELRQALDNIAHINRLLGGNSVTLQAIKKLLKKADIDKVISIVDVGCGNGDMLRMLAGFGKKTGVQFRLTGIDANRFTINYATQLSSAHSNISYKCLDVFSPEFRQENYDIVLCTLTLHHFKDDQVLKIISIFSENARIGVVINDLHRSRIAYSLFRIIAFVFNMNAMAREDGLTSILRGFTKKELQKFAVRLSLKDSTIRWKWAFRYQWIISNI